MTNEPIQASKSTLLHVSPESLKLVTDKNHNLYDSRVELPYDENFVLNIMTLGVLEPVIVHQNGADLEVVAGRSRVKAAIEANARLKKEGKTPILVPIIPKKGDDANLYGILISENEIRKEDSAVNKGEKMQKLSDLGYTVRQIGDIFGMTRQNVENMIAINNLDSQVKSAIEAGEITATAALGLKSLSREEQVATIEMLKASGKKPTVETVKETVETRAFESYDNSNNSDNSDNSDNSVNPERFAPVKFKPQSKKRLEKRLNLFTENGFNSDRYLQSKPADFQEGFAYALKWALGLEQEEVPFDSEDENESED